jgi:hypothetical protein
VEIRTSVEAEYTGVIRELPTEAISRLTMVNIITIHFRLNSISK